MEGRAGGREGEATEEEGRIEGEEQGKPGQKGSGNERSRQEREREKGK